MNCTPTTTPPIASSEISTRSFSVQGLEVDVTLHHAGGDPALLIEFPDQNYPAPALTLSFGNFDEIHGEPVTAWLERRFNDLTDADVEAILVASFHGTPFELEAGGAA